MEEVWRKVKLADCVREKLSYGLNAAAIPYVVGEPKYIRITDISDDGRYLQEDVVSADAEDTSNFVLGENDIVLARTGASTGKSYLYRNSDGVIVYAGFLIKASIDDKLYNSRFIFYALHTGAYYNWVSTTSMRSGQPGINSKEYSSYEFLCPAKQEQDKIAKAIFDVDCVIESIEKLLKKKKDIRVGTVQMLLNGRERLSGYSGEWEKKCVEDVFDFPTETIDVSSFDSRLYIGTDNMISNYGGVKENSISLLYSRVRKYQSGDTLMSNIRPYLKKVWFATNDGGCSNDVIVFRSKDPLRYHPRFLGMVIAQEKFANYVMENVVGTKMPRGDKKTIRKYEFFIPQSFDEQKEIVKIIDDMNDEIIRLEAKLEKYVGIKTSMMQELMTGRIRLI